MEMEKFATDNGFKYEKDWHKDYNRYRHRHSIGYYTYKMKKDSVIANIRFDEKEDVVIITSYTVSREGITIDELEEVL